jgi:hypothetical protein
MKYARTAAFGLALAAGGAAVGAPGHQVTTGPVAEYWMSASTTTGMGGMMGGGGARPNMAQMMSGGFNPNAASHSLILQLGSERHAQGDPAAEHDPPQDLGAGPVLPLVTPQPQAAPTHQEAEPTPPPQYQQPHGRMLIFWGCGEHAGPNQPYVIDFANMANGQGAQQMMALMRGLAISPMQPPSPQHNATYGEWPNQKSDTSVPPDGSLVGPHLVKGNYTPDIQFSLTPAQDFLPAFNMTTNQRNPSGSGGLGWQPMAGAQGFFAGMFGAQGQDQIVMWTSSQVQASAFGLPQYLSNAEITRLVASHVLMPPTQTDCTIPVEAMQAAGRSGFFTLTAYGGEANFAYPERPPAPRPWHIEWTVKVRYRSSTGGIVGMDMSRGQQGDQGQQGQKKPPPKRPGIGSFIPGLGGFIP